MRATNRLSSPAEPPQTEFTKWLWLGIIAANILVVAMEGYALMSGLEQHSKRVQMTGENLSRILERSLADQFADIDLRLREVTKNHIDLLTRTDDSGAETLRAILNHHQIHWTAVDNLRLVNAQGLVVHSAQPPHTPGIYNVADRDYFLRLKANTTDELVISELLISRFSNEPTIILARRLSHPDGTFAGIVMAALPVSRLSKTFSTINVGPTGTIALWDGQARLIARHPLLPPSDTALAQTARSLALKYFITSNQAESISYTAAGCDDVERQYTARKLPGSPFTLTVGLGRQAVFEEWLLEFKALAGFSLLFALVTGLGGALLQHSRRRQDSAYQQLRRSQEFTTRLLDSMSDGVAACDPEGRVIVFNRAATGWHGVDATALPESEWKAHRHLFHEDGLTPVLPEDGPLAHALAGQQLDNQPLVIHVPGRDARDILVSGGPFFDAEGLLLGAVVVMRDITLKRRAEAALQQTAKRLLEAQRIAQVGDWDFDPKTGKITCSEQTCLILGLSPDEPVLDFEKTLVIYTPQDQERLRRARMLALTAGISYEMVLCRPLPDGSTASILGKGCPECDAEGRVVRLFGSVQDVTERRRAETKLRASEFFLKQTQRVASLGGWKANPEADVVFMTEELLRLLELPPDGSLTYHETLSHIHSECREQVDAIIRSALGANRTDSLECRLVTDSGRELWVELRTVGQFTEEDGSPMAVGTIQDVSNRKRAEQELVESKLAAESASKAKSEFLANLSHEIRTPLNGVMGMLQIMSETALDQEQREFLETALRSSRDLLGILNDILDLSKIEAGKMVLNAEPMRPIDLVESVCSIFKTEAVRKNIALTFEVSPDLPKMVLGDRTRLRQVLFNLVGNAVKFTRKGEVRVTAWQGAKEDRFELSVSDTGIGISQDMQQHIFDPFMQVDGSNTRTYSGLGLGLAIVKRLAGLMEGEVLLSSEPDKGTTVGFSIALRTPQPKTDSPSQAEPAPLPPDLTVLLVEDDQVNQITTRRLLTNRGIKVFCADNGQKGLDIFEREHVDVVLMDVQMPVMDGLQATETIRDEARFGSKSHVPIIALTGHAMKGDEQRCLAAGMTAFVSKPIEIAALLRTIALYLA